ncbi:MAG: hypothetical protein WAW88_07540 [Nocardioides sp.]
MLTHLLRACLAVVFAATGLAVTTSAIASPGSTPQSTAKVDCLVFDTTGKCTQAGVVYAITQIGDLTYIGGNFASIGGVPRANLAAIRADGTLDPTWNPSANGIVYALAAAADGSKVFVGGGFTTMGGTTRSRLAAVAPDTGALLTGWVGTVNNNLVRALTTDTADRLYVGGSFARLNGRAIARLGVVSQSSGVEVASFAPNPNNTVRALGLSDDGSKLYAGGSFTTMGGSARPGIAEISTAGAVTSFAPADGGVVISLDVTPSGRLFFGTTSNRTWAYDPAISSAGIYRVRSGGDVQAILATDTEVYIGGHFNNLPEAKVERVALASFNPADGAVTAWNPGANGPFGVWAIAMTNTTPQSPNATPALSIGGDFTRVGDVARRGYTRFLF